MASDGLPDPELTLATAVAATGGRVGFSILRALSDNGPATTRQLLNVTAPLGSDRQSSVDKIVKRLERDGLVTAAEGLGTTHYRVTDGGADVVRAIRSVASPPLATLRGRRLLLVALASAAYGPTMKLLRQAAVVVGAADVDGTFECLALCSDEAPAVRQLEERLRALGATTSSVRIV